MVSAKTQVRVPSLHADDFQTSPRGGRLPTCCPDLQPTALAQEERRVGSLDEKDTQSHTTRQPLLVGSPKGHFRKVYRRCEQHHRLLKGNIQQSVAPPEKQFCYEVKSVKGSLKIPFHLNQILSFAKSTLILFTGPIFNYLYSYKNKVESDLLFLQLMLALAELQHRRVHLQCSTDPQQLVKMCGAVVRVRVWGGRRNKLCGGDNEWSNGGRNKVCDKVKNGSMC